MSLPALEQQGEVYVLRFTDDENRFNRNSIDAINEALADLEAIDGPRALVTTGDGKFFSNGLDLDWMGSGAEDPMKFVRDVTRTLARVLSAPFPTVAALNGHAFAGGAMLALAHDRRVMRADRGYWCVNEVALGMTFATGMNELIAGRLPNQVAHIAMTAAHRFGGAEALASHVVDAIADEDMVLGTAIDLARSLASTAGETSGKIKEQIHADTLAALRS